MSVFAPIISWYFKKRISQLERSINNPIDTQEEMFKKLINTAADTEWGRKYDYKSIHHFDDYRNRVPVQNYDTIKPYIERIMQGEQRVLWPTEIQWFAKSSGTTSDKSKFIPVSYESLDDCHFKGGRDVLTMYCHNYPDNKLFSGKGLLIGGSHKVSSFSTDSFYGDLSAVMMENTPFWVDFFRAPDKSIALMENWDDKVFKMAEATVNEDITNISGVPTWTIVLFEKLFEMTGKNHILDIWPNLELYIHGGVSFVPYREQFNKLIPSSGMKYLETYNASEGFFGIQDEMNRKNELLLMLDYGIYYEFMPMTEYGKDNPKTLTLGEVEEDVNYALIISTNAGLWRYMVGDTIKFSSVKPYRFTITGRTKLFINAFGEEIIIENAEKALAKACEVTDSTIRDYTAAPIFLSNRDEAGHEWLIEFDKAPMNLTQFTHELDKTLKEVNSDYEAKRYMDMALKMPKVRQLQQGTFNSWMKKRGKLGGQHKVPRLFNDRTYVDDILKHIQTNKSAISID